jgi:hypothetical protein
MRTPFPDSNRRSDQCYIALFHGRSDPSEKLTDWGFDGPIIGPVGLGWTYGSLKLFEPGWNDFESLPIAEKLVVYDGKFYGDFEVFHAGDPKLAAAIRERRAKPHDWERFKTLTERAAGGKEPLRLRR